MTSTDSPGPDPGDIEMLGSGLILHLNIYTWIKSKRSNNNVCLEYRSGTMDALIVQFLVGHFNGVVLPVSVAQVSAHLARLSVCLDSFAASMNVGWRHELQIKRLLLWH